MVTFDLRAFLTKSRSELGNRNGEAGGVYLAEGTADAEACSLGPSADEGGQWAGLRSCVFTLRAGGGMEG